MSNHSLENSSELQSLLAENKHLKNLLSRFVGSNSSFVQFNSSKLSKSIAQQLDGAEDVDSILLPCMKLIGEDLNADRVTFFSFNDDKLIFEMQKQWVNEHTKEYLIGELKITTEENPLNNPNEGFCFASSNLKSDLHDSLYHQFQQLGVSSILMIPFQFGSNAKGMLVLESCTFQRQWHFFEVREVEQTAHMLSLAMDALWHKNRLSDIAHLNEKQSHLLQIIKDSKRTKKAVNAIFKTIGSYLGLKSIYVIDKVTYSNAHELSWACDQEHEDELLSNQDIEKLKLDGNNGFVNYFDSSSLLSAGINMHNGTSLILISPLSISNVFAGWLIGEYSGHDSYTPSDLIHFWEPIALYLSEVLYNIQKEKEHTTRYSELLTQSKELEAELTIDRKPVLTESLEIELTIAKEKAERSDRLKSEFLANISHELRTPLNAIVGFSSLLKGNQIPPVEVDTYVDVIQKNSNSLMELIGNIIDVAKIKSGTISVVKQKMDLGEFLNELNNYFRDKVEVEHKGRVKLLCSVPQGGPYPLVSDPTYLRQVLVNLIGNAIKFTIKGFIEFGFTVEDEGYRFFVRDTGIGISKAKQQFIFEPFNKGEENTDRLYRGIGIGLSISEKLVNALGAKIGLISDASKGSEFFFIHPINHVESTPLHKEQVFIVSNPVLQKNYHWPNKMILLVDENSSTHLQVRKFIENTGITLISARTTAGASTLLINRKDIHLVLMDIPSVDSEATALLQIIKQLDKNMPVILHAEKLRNIEEQGLYQHNFDAFLAKPTQKDELLKTIDQLLAVSQ